VAAVKTELTRAAVCPFCSLLCDDLVVVREGQALRVRKNACPRALRGFGRVDRRIEPHVHGKPVPFEDAVARAATILRSASQPLITGMAADVAGCRAAIAVAEACGAAVDHVHGDAALRNLRVLQSRGWMLTTLAEVRNRADVLLLVGTTAAEHYPRFFERFVWNRDCLDAAARRRRKVLFLGDAGRLPRGSRGRSEFIRCANAQVPEMLAALRAGIRGAWPQPGRQLTARQLAALGRFAAMLKRARYGVVAWAPAELDADDGDVVVRAICDLVVDLNAHTRFSGLSLSGNDGGATCQNVTAWQSGVPPRVGYAGGAPAYEPLLHGTATMMRHGTADAVLWINSMNPDLRPPAGGVPTIAIARPSRRLAHDTEVYLPVAAPGIDHPATLFRTDGVVSLPLRPLRRAVAPTAAEVLGAILKQL
jgi:formylmethanofuran dehydrogenase subunit B